MNGKKESIIRATIDLFASRHYDGMTIPMIAKKANIAVGSVYNYFENKEILINEIYQQIFEEFAACIKTSLNVSTYEEEFKYYYRKLFDYSVENANIILFLKYNSNAYYISDTSKLSKQKLVDFLIEFINKGIKLKKLKNIPYALFMPIIYAPIEMLITNAVKKEIDDPNNYFDAMFELTWEALRY